MFCRLRNLTLALAVVLLSACAATTTMTSPQSGATLEVKTSDKTAVPRTESFQTTSFGNYEFRAKSGAQDPFYGILPLKFNGGYLALDILFFAPAAFFNLREVYTFYDFDIAKKQIRYRQTETEEWNVYVPLEAEAQRAREFYQGK